MRRTRIKVMATVPTKRRSVVKEENTDTKTVPKDEENKETREVISQIEETEKSMPLVSTLEKPQEQEENDSEKATTNNAVSNDNELKSGLEMTESINKADSESNKNNVEKNIEKSCENVNGLSENTSNPAEHKNTDHENAGSLKVSQARGSFMRPTPRLDGGGRIRRNSIQGSGASASESEDDSRRTSSVLSTRIRNDSVSSVHSQKGSSRENTSTLANSKSDSNASPNTASSLSSSKTTSNVKQKRKMNVSESARKLAEARREFHLKYEHKQPDRAKLTMYDLIYYNPVTNPIKKKDDSPKQKSSPAVIQPEEDEDEGDKYDENEAMPVPQVKVGPNGQIILDEQSLVIENTGVKKSRQALARMEALVDDENTGNGFYKKRQKSKDWPDWETLKFYKALNTVGTDFLLMQSLFPHRTRQEIKMKFKKEEKINRKFVEKALTYHQEFDIDSLTEDLASFETENRQLEIEANQKSGSRQEKGSKRLRGKLKGLGMAARSISETNEVVAGSPGQLTANETSDVQEIINELESDTNKEDEKKKSEDKKDKKEEKKKGGKRKLETEESEEQSESVGSSDERLSDTEVYVVRPTRSGRLPKVRKLQAPEINTLDNSFESSEQEMEDAASVIQDEDALILNFTEDEIIVDGTIDVTSQVLAQENSHITEAEPGSVVIVSQESQDEPGQTVFQVYMVSSDGDSAGGNDIGNLSSGTTQIV